MWISLPLTDVECNVLELLIKGYTVSQISKFRCRSDKTVSAQKYQIYTKLGIRNDITFWLDLLFSSSVKIRFTNNKAKTGVLSSL
ncbi:LuxR C-terminal-related transcriptional regulator [Escherichia coli]